MHCGVRNGQCKSEAKSRGRFFFAPSNLPMEWSETEFLLRLAQILYNRIGVLA